MEDTAELVDDLAAQVASLPPSLQRKFEDSLAASRGMAIPDFTHEEARLFDLACELCRVRISRKHFLTGISGSYRSFSRACAYIEDVLEPCRTRLRRSEYEGLLRRSLSFLREDMARSGPPPSPASLVERAGTLGALENALDRRFPYYLRNNVLHKVMQHAQA